jgi:hypothetical protein
VSATITINGHKYSKEEVRGLIEMTLYDQFDRVGVPLPPSVSRQVMEALDNLRPGQLT